MRERTREVSEDIPIAESFAILQVRSFILQLMEKQIWIKLTSHIHILHGFEEEEVGPGKKKKQRQRGNGRERKIHNDLNQMKQRQEEEDEAEAATQLSQTNQPTPCYYLVP